MSQSPRVGRLRRVRNEWDAALSILLALLFCVLAFAGGYQIADPQPYSVAAVVGGFTMGSTALVAYRWISDRIKDSDYGQLIRVIDNSESNFSRPYIIVAVTGYLTSLYAVVLALVQKALPDNALIIAIALLIALGSYSILGSISITLLSRRHIARLSRLRALREENERHKRDQERD